MEPKKEEKKFKLSVKATFWIIIALLVALAALMVTLMLTFSSALAGLFVFLIFVFVIVNKACWKCPVCEKHLGRFGKIKKCPHCGEDLKM